MVMAFVESKLKNDLQFVFNAMKNQNKDDVYFAEGLAKACKDFGESGDIVTTDGGTVSTGVFVGSGKGSLTLDDSLMANLIKTCCTQMKNGQGDDTTLANAIGNGILAMTNAGEVNTNVTGVTTSPQGSPVPPSSGSAKGKIACVNTSLISGLIKCFKDMKDKYADEGFDGDALFAGQLASLVNSYFKQGVIATNGTGALSGSAGSGTIT